MATFLVLLLATSARAAYITECGSRPSSECVHRALQLDGAVALSVPGLDVAREAAFIAIAKCLSHTQSKVALPDGTSRSTLGSRTIGGLPEPLEGCVDADEASAAMRALVNEASQRFLELVQPLMRTSHGLLRTRGAPYSALADAARAGEQLEHFHAYRPAAALANASTGEVAVPLHTDAGLFIAIVPAMHLVATPDGASFTPLALRDADGVTAAGARDGFYVQRWDGSHAHVRPRAAPPVVFVLGDGWSTWLNPLLLAPLRAAPHAMVMPRSYPADRGRVSRVWYGRMFLPPADATLHPGGVPFADWRAYYAAHPVSSAATKRSEHPSEATGAALADAGLATRALMGAAPFVSAMDTSDVDAAVAILPSGCAGGRRYLSTTDASGCLSNQILCWHSCVSIQSLPCDKQDAVCQSDSDGHVWTPQDSHCADCQPRCMEPPPSPPLPPGMSNPPSAPEAEPFCTGPGTDMHMTGFAIHRTDCLILLFSDWKLDSAATFAAGVLGMFALAVATELLTFFRRERLTQSASLARRPRAYQCAMASVFTVQVTLGYLLMLAAMTYQVEVFLAVMLGLGFGHWLFNVRAPVGESVEACCVDEVSHSSKSATMRHLPPLGVPKSATRTVPAPPAPPAPAEYAQLSQHTLYLRVAPVTCDGCVHLSKKALSEVGLVADVHMSREGAATVLWRGDLAEEDRLVESALAAIEHIGKTATRIASTSA